MMLVIVIKVTLEPLAIHAWISFTYQTAFALLADQTAQRHLQEALHAYVTWVTPVSHAASAVLLTLGRPQENVTNALRDIPAAKPISATYARRVITTLGPLVRLADLTGLRHHKEVTSALVT